MTGTSGKPLARVQNLGHHDWPKNVAVCKPAIIALARTPHRQHLWSNMGRCVRKLIADDIESAIQHAAIDDHYSICRPHRRSPAPAENMAR